MNELAKRWDGIAADLHKWSSPLKPSDEDVATTRIELRRWAKDHWMRAVRVALLGVTQELAGGRWDLPGVTVNAYDVSPVMVEKHGLQTPDVKSEVRDWFTLADDGLRFDAVLGDGSFVFYGHEKSRELAQVIDRILTPDGIYIGRHFVLPPGRHVLPNEVLEGFKQGNFETLEELKFRVAMSLQPSSSDGIVLGHVEEFLRPLEAQLVERYGAASVSTLDHYKGSQGRLYFPDWTHIRNLFSFSGYRVRALFPSYDFGECCPTIVATRRLPQK